MKYNQLRCAAISSLALLACAGLGLEATESVQPATRCYIIGIPPDQDEAARNEVWTVLIKLAIKQTHAGDRIAVFDALNLKAVVNIVVPNASNENAKLLKLQGDLIKLKAFITAVRPARTVEQLPGMVHAPQFFELLSQIRSGDQPVTVLLFGSPFYTDSELAWNMSEGYVPSDGHLLCDTKDSPIYGCNDRKATMNGVNVHWCYPNEKMFETELHKHRVIRFWTLLCAQRGGVMASFASDNSAVLDRVVADARQPVIDVRIDPAQSKPEMIKVSRTERVETTHNQPKLPTESKAMPPVPERHSAPAAESEVRKPVVITVVPRSESKVVIPAKLTENIERSVAKPAPQATTKEEKSQPTPVVLVPAAPVVPKAIVPPPNIGNTKAWIESPEAPPKLPVPLNPIGKLKVGVRWSAKVDLDLYGKLPTGKELYFKYPRSSEGVYGNDYRSASGDSYETIEFNGDVDLRTVSLYVNFFNGEHPGGVDGVARINFNGSVYESQFKIEASKGNIGHESETRSNSPHWVRLDAAKIVGLSQ